LDLPIERLQDESGMQQPPTGIQSAEKHPAFVIIELQQQNQNFDAPGHSPKNFWFQISQDGRRTNSSSNGVNV